MVQISEDSFFGIQNFYCYVELMFTCFQFLSKQNASMKTNKI